MLFASLGISYDHLAANKIASEIITYNLQQQVMLPYPNATGSWMVSSTVSKYSFRLKTTFSAGLQVAKHSVGAAAERSIVAF